MRVATQKKKARETWLDLDLMGPVIPAATVNIPAVGRAQPPHWRWAHQNNCDGRPRIWQAGLTQRKQPASRALKEDVYAGVSKAPIAARLTSGHIKSGIGDNQHAIRKEGTFEFSIYSNNGPQHFISGFACIQSSQ
jgi:hypothetical protein